MHLFTSVQPCSPPFYTIVDNCALHTTHDSHSQIWHFSLGPNFDDDRTTQTLIEKSRQSDSPPSPPFNRPLEVRLNKSDFKRVQDFPNDWLRQYSPLGLIKRTQTKDFTKRLFFANEVRDFQKDWLRCCTAVTTSRSCTLSVVTNLHFLFCSKASWSRSSSSFFLS